MVITDLGVLQPDPKSCELVMTSMHPGVTRDQCTAATGWPLRFADDLGQTALPDVPRDRRVARAPGSVTFDFVDEALPQRVVFGAGKRHPLADEVRTGGGGRWQRAAVQRRRLRSSLMRAVVSSKAGRNCLRKTSRLVRVACADTLTAPNTWPLASHSGAATLRTPSSSS